MRADEGRNSWRSLIAIKMKACTVVGRRRRARLVTPDLSYVYYSIGREKEKEKCEDDKRDEQKKHEKRQLHQLGFGIVIKPGVGYKYRVLKYYYY